MQEPTIADVYALLVASNAETQAHLSGHDAHFIAHDQRFDAHDKRFDAIEQRLDAHDKRFDAIDGRLDAHDKRFDDLHALIITVKEAAEYQSVRIDRIEVRLENVETQIGALNIHVLDVDHRMERGFARVDNRFDTLNTDMRHGFTELARVLRRRGSRRDD